MAPTTRSRARRAPAAGEGKRGPGGHIAYLLRQAHGAVRVALDAELAGLGLTGPQFLMLNLLDAYPGASGADLARIAMLTPQTVNLIIRKLERDGLVHKCQHETHGRILQLELSEPGSARLRDCRRRADQVERQLLNMLPDDAEQKVRDWLVAIAKTFVH